MKDSYKGNVIAIQEELEKATNLSDQLSEHDREEQDIYAWFLEASSSNLLTEVFKEFETGLKQISLLIDFKSMSFGNRTNMFETVFRLGSWLSQEQINSLKKDLGLMPYHSSEDVLVYLSKVQEIQRR